MSAPKKYCNPCVPFTAPIGPCVVGRKFRISGVSGGCARFSVNFLCGPSFKCNDSAFSMGVHFKHKGHCNKVRRGTKICGNWVGDKTECGFPFYPNCPFHIVITITECGFKVKVNGQHFLDYQHRLRPLQRITHLFIMNDVSLSNVSF